jgi:beta-lactamase regulating signal transducer with metallopeptidase domain
VNSLLYAVNAASAAWWDAMVRATWQGAIALGLVWVVCRCITRIPAAYKVWLWRLAFAKLLLALVWITPISLAVLPLKEQAASSVVPSTAGEVPLITTVEARPPLAAAHAEARLKSDWRVWLLATWCIGVLCTMARIVQQWRTARILLHNSEPITGAALNEMAGRLGNALRLRGVPFLFQSPTLCSPLVIGLFRPRIILPSTMLSTHSASELEMMLAHELAHLRRRDLAWLWLFTFGEALFFFHPLVWLARREWAVATESACDQLALRITGRAPHDYGSMLVDMVVHLRRRGAPAVMSVGMMESAITLKRRLKDMTAKRNWFYTALGIATVSIAILTLAPYRLVAETPDAEALARLKEENAALKQQLAATRAEMESLREKTLALRTRDEAMANKSAEEDLQRSLEKQQAAAERLRTAQRQLAELQNQFTEQHPKMLAQRQEVEKLRDEMQMNSRVLSDKQALRGQMGSVPASPEQIERSREHRELLAREIELAEQQIEMVRKKIESGRETPEALLRVQRDLLDLKLKQADLSGSKAERQAVLLQQLQIAEQLLKEQKRRISVGTLGTDEAIPFEREVLRLKRELATRP